MFVPSRILGEPPSSIEVKLLRASGSEPRRPVGNTGRLPIGAAVLCALTPLALCAARAAAHNPFDQAQSNRAARVARLAPSPRAVVPLLRLWNDWDRSTPSHSLALLEKLESNRRLPHALRAYVSRLHALGQARNGRMDIALETFDALGYLRRWHVIGPFDNEGKTGLDQTFAAERRPAEPPSLDEGYEGKARRVRWRLLPDVVRSGYVPLEHVLYPKTNACGFAETVVHAERARALALWVGAAGAVKMYWNGQEVVRDPAYRGAGPGRSAVVVGAHKGPNRILVKVCVAKGAWGFYVRVTDPSGRPAKGLRLRESHDTPPQVSRGHGIARLPRAPRSLLQALEQAAARPRPTAQALEDLARMLTYTRADDPAERRAKQLAALAAHRRPTLPRLELASSLAETRGERMRFAEAAMTKFGSAARAKLLMASVIATGPTAESALPLLDGIQGDGATSLRAMALRARILGGLGLERASLAEVRRLAKRAPSSPWAIRMLAEATATAELIDESLALRRRLLELRHDDLRSRRILLVDALERGRTREAFQQLDSLRMLGAGSSRTLQYVAGVYDAVGRSDLTLATYREAMLLCPHDPSSHVRYGKALLRAQRPDAAAQALRKALALRPQDARVRELLEQIRPEQRADEAYAAVSDTFLKRRKDYARYSNSVLHDLTVNTVYPSGLGSSFRQQVFQVHDKEGARRLRTYSIRFDPITQRVDLRLARIYRAGRTLEAIQTYERQLGEPWYRIYYDTRARVVIFPDLEPGDVVELRYRVDDVAHRNLFADYYGDLKLFQGLVPSRHIEYVLIAPVSRSLHLHKPRLSDLEYSQQTRGQQRIHRLVAKDVPAIQSEVGMPGIAEVSPYLHVSTYESWQDVGRWYWGLIKDQLYADEALKATVRKLTRGVSDIRTKVERIHNWVVRNTRYVALEFGIHGYLPYRVPLVVQRGFGDCKDKASLIYTMLREAGVATQIVLVRTRRNGRIEGLPASLAVFDHAIAYVPDLDLYLDGTAEHSGTQELPAQDQGVMVLHVGPETAELRRTPTALATSNHRRRKLQVALAADGSAKVRGDELVRGVEAASYRDYYQAAGTRLERLERVLAADHPGIRLSSQAFRSLADLQSPVHYSYRAQVPQMARLDGDEMHLAPSTLNDLVRTFARSPSRRYTLDLQSTSSYLEERSVTLPAGTSASMPPGGEARSAFGRLRLQFRARGNQVVGRTEFEVTRDRVAPGEYPAFRRWVQQADMLLRQRVVVRRSLP